MEKFSDTLQVFNGKIENPALQGSISYLQEKLRDNFKLLEWSDGRISVPLEVNVDLPTLGNYKGIDIRSTEPISIVFNLKDYPLIAPMVFTDRLDFPKNKLAHLYISRPERPCAFCYVRENNDDWYANKRIQDLLLRIENWLRDAATGELTQDGSQFDPLRLEGYSGTALYDYDTLSKIIHSQESITLQDSWSVGLFERIVDDKIHSFKLIKIVTRQNFNEIATEFDKEKEKSDEIADKKHYRFGFLVWSKKDDTFSDYHNQLPDNWGEFKAFCDSYLIEYHSLENFLVNTESFFDEPFPIIIGIKRPINIIGFSSNIEFVNFRITIKSDDISNGAINNDNPISFQAHNQPLTLSKAQNISNSIKNFSKNSVVFGCGALGSKIVMHFGKAGQVDFTLIDPDQLSPHNIVRHALSPRDISKNKATALCEAIKEIYPGESIPTLLNGTGFKDGFFENPDTFKHYEWIFDFTASESFFNRLVLANSMNDSNICNASISDFGNLGIMLKEGKERNPRVDDLQVLLFDQYKYDIMIKEWLMREKKTTSTTTVSVGIGCNSETTILSDIKVSNHAAYFAGAIEHEMKVINSNGKIILHQISDDEEYSANSKSISIEPLDILSPINDNSWSIRFKKGILEKIQYESDRASGVETGGIFIGVANYKRKTIHVTDLLAPPPDSKGDSVCFYRGHEGLPEKISEITKSSGGQLGYIGEWHSHPYGPNGLSSVDMDNVKKFKTEFDRLLTPLPVFLTVVAPDGILPFVF